MCELMKNRKRQGYASTGAIIHLVCGRGRSAIVVVISLHLQAPSSLVHVTQNNIDHGTEQPHTSIMTQPVYFGLPSSSGDLVSTRMKALELNLIRTSPSHLGLLGVYHRHQEAYPSYRANIPAFMHAYATEKDVSLNKAGFFVNWPAIDCIKVPFPDVVIYLSNFRNGMPSKEVETSLDALGAKKSIFDKKAYFRVPIVSAAVAKQVMDLGGEEPDIKTFTLNNVTNINGLKMFMSLLKLISLFFHTNRYPAFWGDAETTGINDAAAFDVVPRIGMKRKAVEQARRRRDHPEEDLDVGEYEPTDALGDEILLVSDPNSLSRAKAPLSKNDNPWGVANTIPDAPGIFFQYVDELAKEDKSTVLDTVRHYFAKFLGSTVAGIHEAWAFYYKTWFRLADTRSANIITHMFTGISLSLQTQTVCFPVFNGGHYQGYVLSGYHFSVSVRGVIYNPIGRTELLTLLNDANTHIKFVREAIEIISDSTETGDEDFLPLADEVTSFRELYIAARHAINLTLEDRQKIAKLGEKMSFTTKFWNASQANLELVLRAAAIYDPNREVNEDGDYTTGLISTAPMAPSAILRNDKWSCLLSVFGEFAPSPNLPGGDAISARAKPEFFTGVDASFILGFRDKVLAVAIEDWEKFSKEGTLTNNPKGRSAGSRDRSFIGESRQSIGKLMLDIVTPFETRAAFGRPNVGVVASEMFTSSSLFD